MRQSKKSVFVILVVVAAIAGCAGQGKVQSAAPMSSGGSIISIEASGSKFSPNVIRVEKPGLLAIEIKNVSGSERNFTLRDLNGQILKSVKINPRGSVIVNVELPQLGVYKFYGKKTFGSMVGMKGQIIVGR
jgi:hypothetical protein